MLVSEVLGHAANDRGHEVVMTKHPRSADEPECEWCDGSGEWEVEIAEWQGFKVVKATCDKCHGTGIAKFDPENLSARTRHEK